MNNILKIESDIEIDNARRIVDTRNKVIHGYDTVDNAVIWGIIVNHVPKLYDEINQYLEE